MDFTHQQLPMRLQQLRENRNLADMTPARLSQPSLASSISQTTRHKPRSSLAPISSATVLSSGGVIFQQSCSSPLAQNIFPLTSPLVTGGNNESRSSSLASKFGVKMHSVVARHSLSSSLPTGLDNAAIPAHSVSLQFCSAAQHRGFSNEPMVSPDLQTYSMISNATPEPRRFINPTPTRYHPETYTARSSRHTSPIFRRTGGWQPGAMLSDMQQQTTHLASTAETTSEHFWNKAGEIVTSSSFLKAGDMPQRFVTAKSPSYEQPSGSPSSRDSGFLSPPQYRNVVIDGTISNCNPLCPETNGTRSQENKSVIILADVVVRLPCPGPVRALVDNDRIAVPNEPKQASSFRKCGPSEVDCADLTSDLKLEQKLAHPASLHSSCTPVVMSHNIPVTTSASSASCDGRLSKVVEQESIDSRLNVEKVAFSLATLKSRTNGAHSKQDSDNVQRLAIMSSGVQKNDRISSSRTSPSQKQSLKLPIKTTATCVTSATATCAVSLTGESGMPERTEPVGGFVGTEPSIRDFPTRSKATPLAGASSKSLRIAKPLVGSQQATQIFNNCLGRALPLFPSEPSIDISDWGLAAALTTSCDVSMLNPSGICPEPSDQEKADFAEQWKWVICAVTTLDSSASSDCPVKSELIAYTKLAEFLLSKYTKVLSSLKISKRYRSTLRNDKTRVHPPEANVLHDRRCGRDDDVSAFELCTSFCLFSIGLRCIKSNELRLHLSALILNSPKWKGIGNLVTTLRYLNFIGNRFQLSTTPQQSNFPLAASARYLQRRRKLGAGRPRGLQPGACSQQTIERGRYAYNTIWNLLTYLLAASVDLKIRLSKNICLMKALARCCANSSLWLLSPSNTAAPFSFWTHITPTLLESVAERRRPLSCKSSIASSEVPKSASQMEKSSIQHGLPNTSVHSMLQIHKKSSGLSGFDETSACFLSKRPKEDYSDGNRIQTPPKISKSSVKAAPQLTTQIDDGRASLRSTSRISKLSITQSSPGYSYSVLDNHSCVDISLGEKTEGRIRQRCLFAMSVPSTADALKWALTLDAFCIGVLPRIIVSDISLRKSLTGCIKHLLRTARMCGAAQKARTTIPLTTTHEIDRQFHTFLTYISVFSTMIVINKDFVELLAVSPARVKNFLNLYLVIFSSGPKLFKRSSDADSASSDRNEHTGKCATSRSTVTIGRCMCALLTLAQHCVIVHYLHASYAILCKCIAAMEALSDFGSSPNNWNQALKRLIIRAAESCQADTSSLQLSRGSRW